MISHTFLESLKVILEFRLENIKKRMICKGDKRGPSPIVTTNYAFIAQRNLAERARLLLLHSSAEGRIGLEAIS